MARRSAALKYFVSRFAIDGFFVDTGYQRIGDQAFALLIGDRPNLRHRRHHKRALDNRRAAFFIEEGNQGLADPEFGNRGRGIELWVRAHRVRRCFDGFLVARRERAQGVLNTVAQLRQHRVGYVKRVLRDEVHPHAFAADQAHHLLDFFQQRLRCFVEEQVSFVKKEHQLGFLQITGFGQMFVQFCQQPEEEGRIKFR